MEGASPVRYGLPASCASSCENSLVSSFEADSASSFCAPSSLRKRDAPKIIENVLWMSELMKPTQRRTSARERALPSPSSLLCGACSAMYSRIEAFCVAVQSPSVNAGTAPSGFTFRKSAPLSSSRLSLCVSYGLPTHSRTMWEASEHAPGM